MNANPTINSQAAYGHASAMNQGPFMQMQQPSPSPQSFQSFNPGPYPSSTPQPQGQFPPQHFLQQQQAGFASPQDYGGNPQGRGMSIYPFRMPVHEPSMVPICYCVEAKFPMLTCCSTTHEPDLLSLSASVPGYHWPISRSSLQHTCE